ncbi:MAG TPA: hypothetical protein VIY69_12655 [Candidatus Acidoferrales bacterium]
MNKPGRETRRLSRREFTRGGIVAAAAAVPASLDSKAAAQTPAQEPALSTDSQTEVNIKVAAVLGKYGKLLSNAEKLDVRRLLTEGQKPLETMRLFPLDNADQPANVLKLYPDSPVVHAADPKPQNNKG